MPPGYNLQHDPAGTPEHVISCQHKASCPQEQAIIAFMVQCVCLSNDQLRHVTCHPPAWWAASSLSFTPPIGSTSPRKVNSPVIAVSALTRLQGGDGGSVSQALPLQTWTPAQGHGVSSRGCMPRATNCNWGWYVVAFGGHDSGILHGCTGFHGEMHGTGMHMQGSQQAKPNHRSTRMGGAWHQQRLAGDGGCQSASSTTSSNVQALLCSTHLPVKRETRATARVMPADGPSFCTAPAGRWTCTSQFAAGLVPLEGQVWQPSAPESWPAPSATHFCCAEMCRSAVAGSVPAAAVQAPAPPGLEAQPAHWLLEAAGWQEAPSEGCGAGCCPGCCSLMPAGAPSRPSCQL